MEHPPSRWSSLQSRSTFVTPLDSWELVSLDDEIEKMDAAPNQMLPQVDPSEVAARSYQVGRGIVLSMAT